MILDIQIKEKIKIEKLKEIQSQISEIKSEAGIVVEEGDIVFTREQLEDFLIEYNEEMRMVTVTTGKGQFIIPLTSISHMQADDEVKSLVVRRRKRSKIVVKPSPVVEAVV